MPLSCTIVHALPSRVRLRIEALSNRTIEPRLASFLADQPGINEIRINPLCRSAVVEFERVHWTAERLRAFLSALPDDALADHASRRAFASQTIDADADHSTFALILSTATLLLGYVGHSFCGLLMPWLFAGSALPMFSRAFDALTRRGVLTVDVLDASAVGVLIGQSRLSTAAFMIWLVNVADFIRNATMERSRRAISTMLDVAPLQAWVLRGEVKTRVPVTELAAGDIVVVYAGERIPVDGVVISGSAWVDQQSLTGESMPVAVSDGDDVFAATVLREGKLYIRAERIGQGTEAAKIVRLIEDAPTRDTRMQNYAEQWANALVPVSFVSAAASAVLSSDLNRASSLLIIDYGTGIRVAAPTTVLAAMTKAAGRGILFKGGRAFERLAEVDTVMFDKTGTLTSGRPEIIEARVYHPRFHSDDCLRLAASAERRLTHPLAEAIVRTAVQKGLDIPERADSHFHVGQGVHAHVNGYAVDVGNERFMASCGVSLAQAQADLQRIGRRAASPICVAVDRELIGVLACADPVRHAARDVLRALRRHVTHIVMLTGDHPAVAQAVAASLDIASYEADLFPDQKVEMVKRWQRAGHRVAVIGDGINDSPALAQADVGIAVKGGADIARETAHVVLLKGGLWKIPLAFDIAHEAVSLVKQNWTLIAVPNTVALALAFAGLIGPAGATMISNGSTIVAAGNALRPLLKP